jgi:hypothetical protein
MLENNPLATSPKSSELTALSVVRLIELTRHHLTMTGDHAAKKPADNGGQSQHPRRNLP